MSIGRATVEMVQASAYMAHAYRPQGGEDVRRAELRLRYGAGRKKGRECDRCGCGRRGLPEKAGHCQCEGRGELARRRHGRSCRGCGDAKLGRGLVSWGFAGVCEKALGHDIVPVGCQVGIRFLPPHVEESRRLIVEFIPSSCCSRHITDGVQSSVSGLLPRVCPTLQIVEYVRSLFVAV